MTGGTSSPPAGEAEIRADLDALVTAALEAVDPERCVSRALEEGEPAIPAPSRRDARDVVLVAVGKAAPGMARGVLPRLGERIRDGLVLAPADGPADAPEHPAVRMLRGGHPLPTPDGVEAARSVLDLAEGAGADDTVVVLLSGGGSALLTLPVRGVTLDDVRTTTADLLRAGAPIGELNAVRKHLDRLKGGRLARAASPAALRAAVISDVVGDRLDVIASGPVSPDPTRFRDALEVIEAYGLSRSAPRAVRAHLEAGAAGERDETPKPGHECFRSARVRVVANLATAVAEAQEEALRRGYRVRLLGTEATGEAREVGARLGRLGRRVRQGAEAPEPPACLLGGGETTVTVRGDGRGGRNQEVALGAASEIAGDPGLLVAAVGTDGVDGPTDAAGALATGRTMERAAAAGLSAERTLARNDADPFFRALGDRIVTGPTGTNVMDLHVVLVEERPRRSGVETVPSRVSSPGPRKRDP